MQKEFDWAIHIGIKNILLPSLYTYISSTDIGQSQLQLQLQTYAKFVNHLAKSIVSTQKYWYLYH